eukprot:1060520-Pyramimonas_sp.AAC.1
MHGIPAPALQVAALGEVHVLPHEPRAVARVKVRQEAPKRLGAPAGGAMFPQHLFCWPGCHISDVLARRADHDASGNCEHPNPHLGKWHNCNRKQNTRMSTMCQRNTSREPLADDWIGC